MVVERTCNGCSGNEDRIAGEGRIVDEGRLVEVTLPAVGRVGRDVLTMLVELIGTVVDCVASLVTAYVLYGLLGVVGHLTALDVSVVGEEVVVEVGTVGGRLRMANTARINDPVSVFTSEGTGGFRILFWYCLPRKRIKN